MKEAMKRNLFIIIPTLCMILVIITGFLVSYDTVEGREISYGYSVTADMDSVYAVGYENRDGVLVPQREDPYLVLPVADEKINDVRIAFASPFESDCEVTVAYATQNSAMSVDNSVRITVKKGATELFCALPYDIYTVLECHIPARVEVEEVILTHVLSSTPVSVRRLNTPLLLWILIPSALAYAAYVGFALVYKRKKEK